MWNTVRLCRRYFADSEHSDDNLDVLIYVFWCTLIFYILSFCSFYFYSIFYGSCGLIQIKTMMILMMITSCRRAAATICPRPSPPSVGAETPSAAEHTAT